MKTLYKTERTSAVSKDIGRGPSRPGVAWFEMVLHDGPPDDKTWEGGGQTVAYWRENLARHADDAAGGRRGDGCGSGAVIDSIRASN